MVWVTLEMRWSTASIACAAPDVSEVVRWVRRESIDWIAWAVPSVSEEVSWVRRESIDWIACAAPSVSDEASEPRRPSMVSVTDFARAFFRKFGALILHQFIECAHLQGKRIVRGLGLADDLLHQRVHGHVQRIAGLVAGTDDLGCQAVAGFIDLADQIAAAQLKFQQQRVAGILQRVMNLFGPIGNSVDDGGGALLEFAGDAVDPLVQDLVDTVGKLDELVMHVAGLEVEAGGEALAGVEHRARGFGAGFLKTVEQVAAALPEREDHVVAGIAERTCDVGAAFFQRTGNALCNLVDAGGDRVRDQRDIVAQVDLHAGDGAANLLGLADQIVALMRDILQQSADSHLVVAVSALKRGDFIGNQSFEFAGACNGAFDAVAHGRDLAPDRLTNRYH